jgi:hypothetical protein
MGLTSVFKNFGHAIAAGAKYFEVGVQDALKATAKVEKFAPEAELLIGALAGPQAATLADLGFHALGAIAQEIEKMNDLGVATAAEKGMNVMLDLATIQQVRSSVGVIKQVLVAKGTPAPAA